MMRTNLEEKMLDGFLELNWPQVKVDLARDFNIHIRLDPPKDQWGFARDLRYWHQSNGEWTLTNPLPADVDSIAYYLRKGFRLDRDGRSAEGNGLPPVPEAVEHGSNGFVAVETPASDGAPTGINIDSGLDDRAYWCEEHQYRGKNYKSWYQHKRRHHGKDKS